MQEQRLFRLALEALVVNCFYEPSEGWRANVIAHRQGEPWSDAEESMYFRLSSAELMDVICEEVSRRLAG